MGDIVEIDGCLVGLSRFQGGCTFVAVTVGEIEKTNGDAG